MNPLLLDMIKKGGTSSRAKYNQRNNNGRQMGGNDFRNNRLQQRPQMRPPTTSYQPNRPFIANNNQAQKPLYQARSAPMNYQQKTGQLYEMPGATTNQSRIETSKFNNGYQSMSNIYGQQQMQPNFQSILPTAAYNVPPPQIYTYPPPVLPVKN